MRLFNLYLPIEMFKRIERRSKRDKVSLAEVCRRALELYLGDSKP